MMMISLQYRNVQIPVACFSKELMTICLLIFFQIVNVNIPIHDNIKNSSVRGTYALRLTAPKT